MRATDRPVIGMFDSGMGGISVLGEAVRQLPWADYHYFADVDHVPYGSKSSEEVLGYVFAAADFLISKEIDCLVIACNTATSVAAEALRTRHTIPIIGMEPAVKPALAFADPAGRNRVVVTATDMTLKMNKLHSLIDRLQVRDKIDALSLQRLVSFAEKGDFESDELRVYLKGQFSSIDLETVHSVVLGCTHFSFYKGMLREILPPHIHLIDGNEGTVRRMASFFKVPDTVGTSKDALGLGQMTFYESGRTMKGERRELYLSYLERAKAIE